MAKTRNKNTKMKKRDQARTIAKRFRVLKEKLEEASKERMEVRTVHQIKFGISFTIPDRMTTEINDKKSISGLRPLRITRVPCGGPMEFHEIVKEAEKGSAPLKNHKKGKPPNPKTAYHRSCFNEWHPQVFHFISNSYFS
ncbi:hypothetical protein E6C27_scaffold274G003090 [Cucumis melo var. makuwa]|uniref:Uncharacterized protein n=1 Tax=Cucumis melo var. makuwa TaxID=1194695 RepID=A0A5A7UWL1_CUCMM|nr:hypothetical protein E6C27_scaffold274G003090 [Cucumis melo var. makuwa]